MPRYFRLITKLQPEEAMKRIAVRYSGQQPPGVLGMSMVTYQGATVCLASSVTDEQVANEAISRLAACMEATSCEPVEPAAGQLEVIPGSVFSVEAGEALP